MTMPPISDEAVWRVCEYACTVGKCKRCGPAFDKDGLGIDEATKQCRLRAEDIIQTVLRAVSENPTTGSEK